jgi:regulator of sirC expression with transglutaminase-like and TPR domain
MSEISALISLLDDPDESIYSQIKDKIVSMGGEVIPELENAFETNFDSLVQQRSLDLIHEIQFKATLLKLHTWKDKNQADILEGAIIVAKYQYPDLSEEKIKKHVEQIRNDVWLEINDSLTALEKIKVLNHILFDIHGFSGNTQNFHAPQNSFINTVLESKKGNPLLLSIIYLSIAQGLKIPVYGVNLPEHFIVAFVDDEDSPFQSNISNVLFYINPFSRGTIFGKIEIDNFLKQLNLKEENQYYLPCNNLEMMKRLLRNLSYSFEKSGYKEKVDEVNVMLNTLLQKP